VVPEDLADPPGLGLPQIPEVRWRRSRPVPLVLRLARSVRQIRRLLLGRWVQLLPSFRLRRSRLVDQPLRLRLWLLPVLKLQSGRSHRSVPLHLVNRPLRLVQERLAVLKIKSPIPLTVALLPSHLADQVYDKTMTLTDALDQTGCKERGVQSMSFNCTFNVANGTQTLLILPDIDFSGHKKATVEANTVKCVDHCELLSPTPNP
jgi:hypothetical protein